MYVNKGIWAGIWLLGVGSLGAADAEAAGQPTKLEYKVVKSFSALVDRQGADPLKWEVNSTDGLAWDGDGIWMSGCDSMQFMKVDADGNKVDNFMLPGMEMADHLAWDGQYLWAVVHSMPDMAGPADGRLIQIDTKERKIVKTIEVPFRDKNAMVPMGLAWDGEHLWSMDPKNRQIYRIDPKTGAGKDTPIFANPTINGQQINSCGISWDGHSCLWISDLGNGAYFQVDPKTGEIVSYLVPPDNPEPAKYGQFRDPSVKKLFTGMTTDDSNRVWVVDEIEGNPLVYELAVDFPTTGPCAHPVADGQACTASGQPFCGKNSVCYGAAGQATTCRAKCDLADNDCPSGKACWSKGAAGNLCLADLSGAPGVACSDAGACQSGLCIAAGGGAATSCAKVCNAGNPCPAGLGCVDHEGQKVCVKSATPPVDTSPQDTETGESGGGGCALTSVAQTGWASLVLIGLLAVARLSRRRRRRR